MKLVAAVSCALYLAIACINAAVVAEPATQPELTTVVEPGAINPSDHIIVFTEFEHHPIGIDSNSAAYDKEAGILNFFRSQCTRKKEWLLYQA